MKSPVEKPPAAKTAPPSYPSGTVRRLLDTDRVTPATRKALKERLDQKLPAAPRFFDLAMFKTLQAVCSLLIPQSGDQAPVPIAWDIDARLADGRGNGWRYDDLPPDGDAYRLGLQGIEAVSAQRFGVPFTQLEVDRQEEILLAVQRGEVSDGVWEGLNASRFFEELLAEAAESYYSHPLAQEEIGYVGMADAHGWQRIGLNEREDHEPDERLEPGNVNGQDHA